MSAIAESLECHFSRIPEVDFSCGPDFWLSGFLRLLPRVIRNRLVLDSPPFAAPCTNWLDADKPGLGIFDFAHGAFRCMRSDDFRTVQLNSRKLSLPKGSEASFKPPFRCFASRLERVGFCGRSFCVTCRDQSNEKQIVGTRHGRHCRGDPVLPHTAPVRHTDSTLPDRTTRRSDYLSP